MSKSYLLSFLLIFKVFIFIQTKNVQESIYSNKKSSFSHAKLKSQNEKPQLKSLRQTSKFSNEISNSPFSDSSSSSDSLGALKASSDNSTVLEASIKFSLPPVIQKCITKGDIALTFDDGVGRATKDVLEILRREKVKATFFVLGNTLDSHIIGQDFANKTLHQMIQDGHTIASHSYSHPNFDEYWPEGIQHEMDKARNLFKTFIGVSPRFMRPPFGNATPRTIQALHDLGYFIIGWNVDTNDWMHVTAPEKSLLDFAKKVPEISQIDNIRFQKGGLSDLGVKTMINSILDSKIALMHDIHPTIVFFLPQLIQQARNLGYRFVNMEECLGGINPYWL